MTHWDNAALSFDATGQMCPRFNFDHTLSVGTGLRLGFQRWEIYGAGGHDPDAAIFFEPTSRVLISGDALWKNGFGVVFPELKGRNAFCDVGATLNLIEQFNPTKVIPGHGPVFKYNKQVLEVARRRLDAFFT